MARETSRGRSAGAGGADESFGRAFSGQLSCRAAADGEGNYSPSGYYLASYSCLAQIQLGHSLYPRRCCPALLLVFASCTQEPRRRSRPYRMLNNTVNATSRNVIHDFLSRTVDPMFFFSLAIYRIVLYNDCFAQKFHIAPTDISNEPRSLSALSNTILFIYIFYAVQ